MKFLPLLLANLRRRKIRTVLTIGSFAVAMFLFGILGSIHYGFRQGIDIAGADRLVVIGRTSIMQPLPITYLARLKRLPGVRDAAHATWFGGVYQDVKNFFPQFVIAPEDWRRMYPEYVVRPGAVGRLPRRSPGLRRRHQAGAAVRVDGRRQDPAQGARLSRRRQLGFQRARHLPRHAPGRRRDAALAAARLLLREGAVLLAGASSGGTWCAWRTPTRRSSVAKAIDAEFGNSASETRTQTESAFAAGFVQQMGNIEFLLLAIGGVVFFTLLLVTGNTMAIAVRERTGELAVLKAIGFSDRFVLGLVLAESLLIAAIGGALGLWLAHGVTQQDITSGLILLYLPPIALAGGAAFALGTGLLAGLLPAVGAMRLNVATRACGGSDDGDSARLQHPQRDAALDVVARGDHRDRRHGGRVHRDAGARARVQGDARLVGPAAERHRAAVGRRLRDDQRHPARRRCASSKTRRRWRGAGPSRS